MAMAFAKAEQRTYNSDAKRGENMDRRDFLTLPILGLPVLLAANNSAQTNASGRFKLPVVISTWDSGLSANAAAWQILSKGGKALDAVEAAGRASEDEVS